MSLITEELQQGTVVLIKPSTESDGLIGRLAVVERNMYAYKDEHTGQFGEFIEGVHPIEARIHILRVSPLNPDSKFMVKSDRGTYYLDYGLIRATDAAPVTNVPDDSLDMFLELWRQDELQAAKTAPKSKRKPRKK